MINDKDILVKILRSELITRVLQVLKKMNLPFDYYIGAGCITNTVWNDISGYPLEYGISDIDFVYYDSEDLTSDGEKKLKAQLLILLGDIPYKLDVKNQARVHLWYENKFGFPIIAYPSLKAAIDSWPTSANALGVRQEQDGTYNIYAPFELDDLFSMTVRPNKKMITREIFENKANKWKRKWPDLEIIPW